jgi:hypothetical protein
MRGFQSLMKVVVSRSHETLSRIVHSRYLPQIIVVTCWLISVMSRLIRSGTVYGLDFGLFHPDGINYLRFAQDIVDLNIQNSTIYAWSRPLYPILSAPFLMVFGTHGMLVVPVLSYLLFGLVLIRFGSDRKTKLAISILFLVFSSSPTLLRWVVADLTDSLHLFLFALCCLGIHKQWRFRSLLTIVILGALARPMGLLWAALFAALAIADLDRLRLRKKYLILSLFSLALFLLNSLLMAIFGGFGPNSRSLPEQITSIPFNFVSLLIVEFGQLAVMDRVLFYLMVASFVIAISSFREMWSSLHLSVAFASFLLSSWIGVWGVNFRYQLPLIATAIMVFLRLPFLVKLLKLPSSGFKDLTN